MLRASPGSSPRPLAAPSGATACALAGLLVLGTAFCFVAYSMSRALAGGFGAGLATIAICVASTAASTIFLWWLAPLADFGEIAWIHLPADRRTRRGGCPHCGYPHFGTATCTECGESTEPLPAWTLGLRPVRRLALVLVPALVIGSVAGEWWSRLDESRFATEAAAVEGPYARPRAFPAGFATMRSHADGSLTSESWPEDTRDRGWRPRDKSLRARGYGWREQGAAGSAEAPAPSD